MKSGFHNRSHKVCEGSSRADKDRLTWICRQVCFNYFKKVREGEDAPRVRGEMLPSILLVQGSVFCRLENICFDTETWLEDEDFWWQGKHIVRKAGEKVPKNLMQSWRTARKKDPSLFGPDVLIWASENAYQNEVA